MDQTLKNKLKAYFSARYLTDGDAYDGSGCDTCGPDIEGFKIETILDLIDEFDESKIK